MSWPAIALGELCEINIGKTPSRANSSYWGDGHPWLSIADMKQGKSISETKEQITDVAIRETKIRKVPKGTVLFSFKLSIGKVGVTEIPMYTNEAIAALPIIDDSRLCKEYLVHALTKIDASRTTDRAVMGATLNKRKLAELRIPIPPLAEQKRIATILDKADAIRGKRQHAIQLADEFLRAVFLDMFGDIPAKRSPFEFKGCRGAVSASSGKSSKAVLSDQITEIPIYGGNGVNGYATKALYDEPVIVVGRVGQQCAITHLTSGPSWVTDNAIVVKIVDKEKFEPVYLAHAFKNSPIRDVVTRLDLPFVNQTMILDHPIPNPPIELQRKYVDIYRKVLTTVGAENKASDYSFNCFNSLSQKAFSGQL